MMTEPATLAEPVAFEPPVPRPPTQDDLPYRDGIPMETQRHVLQMFLLIDSLALFWDERQDFFVGGNMFVYFSPEQVRTHSFRGPDVFVAQGVPRRERKSWLVWEEGKGPDVVIELLSQSTASRDRSQKKEIYQDYLRVPEYFWFDPFSGKWAGFVLKGGAYEPLKPDDQDRLISQQLGLVLVRWEGSYQHIPARWLRWSTLEGGILPTPQEQAEAARKEADAVQREAEAARKEAEEMKALLERYRERFGSLNG
jgi:Uma2 family endonuclease